MHHADHAEPADTTIDLGRLWAGLRAARGRIALAALLAGGVAAGLTSLVPRPVVVEARALIETPAPTATPTAGDRLRRDDEIVAAQIALLGSEALLRRVTAADPQAVAAALGETGEARAMDRDAAEGHRTAALAGALAVERVDRTRLLTLRLATADADAAGRVLATVERQWIAGAEEARARTRAELQRRHASAVEVARHRLAEAETDEAAAPTATGEVESDAAGTRAALRIERDAAEARLKRLESFAAGGASGAERAVDAAPTEGLRDLRDQRGALRNRLAQLSAVYLGNHPLMKDIRADFAELRNRMRAELPRAVAAAKADLAALDRRLAEAAAETTASLPPTAAATATATAPTLDALRAAVVEAEARRDAAVAEGLAAVAVEIRPLGAPAIVGAASPWRPLLAAVLAGFLAVGIASIRIARRTDVAARAVRNRDDDTSASRFVAAPPVAAAPLPPLPVEATLVAAAVPEPALPADPAPIVAPAPDRDDALRAERYRVAAMPVVGGLWRALAAECGTPCRLVVVSTRDAAWARGAGEAIAAAGARLHDTVGHVDLGRRALHDERPGVTDLLDGTASLSEVVRRDLATGIRRVGAGSRDVTDADLCDPGFVAFLEALEVTWDVSVVDAGRLEGRDGVAALLTTANAVVLAEDDGDDPQPARIAEILMAAGCPTWILDAPVEATAMVVDRVAAA